MHSVSFSELKHISSDATLGEVTGEREEGNEKGIGWEEGRWLKLGP